MSDRHYSDAELAAMSPEQLQVLIDGTYQDLRALIEQTKDAVQRGLLSKEFGDRVIVFVERLVAAPWDLDDFKAFMAAKPH